MFLFIFLFSFLSALFCEVKRLNGMFNNRGKCIHMTQSNLSSFVFNERKTEKIFYFILCKAEPNVYLIIIWAPWKSKKMSRPSLSDIFNNWNNIWQYLFAHFLTFAKQFSPVVSKLFRFTNHICWSAKHNILIWIGIREPLQLISWATSGAGADAIKKFTPSLGIPYLGV